jgi:rhamnulokinase
MEKHYLALDLGAESGRAIVGTVAGGQLTLMETHRFANKPLSRPFGLHWDVYNLWIEIKKEIAASAGRFQMEGLALDTWGVDFAFLDNDGALLGDPHHYRDTRTDGMSEEGLGRVPQEEIFK